MTLRNDATRQKIRASDARKPRTVIARQGQVLMDTDIDQQSTLILGRIEKGTADGMGSPGRLVVPSENPGFSITPAGALADYGVSAGHGYLGGWLVENTAPCTLATQPHPRTDTTPSVPMMMILKSLIRLVDPVEETAWADSALGDAQASGRGLIDWQVFPFTPSGGWGAAFGCGSAVMHPAYLALSTPSNGTLKVVQSSAGGGADPCSLTPAGGFTRGENLLYRIEVHGGTKRTDLPDAAGAIYGLNGLRIKMSRRNASVMVRITDTQGAKISVEPAALDRLNWFAPGLHAEFVSLHDDIMPPAPDTAATERLFRVAQANEDSVTLESAAAAFAGSIAGQADWYLRLWDGFAGLSAPGTVTVSTSGHPTISQDIDLGDGLSVVLGSSADATFRRGDHWTFAARADGSVDWPGGQAETPHGPEIRFAPLAAIRGAATAPSVEDCRIPAASLTDRALHYRGGDGQTVPLPEPHVNFVAMPAKLRVAAMRGRNPVAGATVRWSVPSSVPTCRINGAECGAAPVDLVTDAQGLCEVTWSVAGNTSGNHFQVQAQLLSITGAPEPQAIIFSASFRTAGATSYHPGACNLLSNATNVQDALDTLCNDIGAAKDPETLLLSELALFGSRGDRVDLIQEGLILNGEEVSFDAFGKGIGVGVDGPPLGCTPQEFDPIIEVELDLPYPITDPDKQYWQSASRTNNNRQPAIRGPFGFQRVRLDGTVHVVREGGDLENGLIWKPSKHASDFINSLPVHRGGQRMIKVDGDWTPSKGDRLLCRLKLRAAHVWAEGKNDAGSAREPIWLNAEHLGTSANVTRRELLLMERDPQRAADLDVFLYLRIG